MERSELTIYDYFRIIRRKKWYIIISFLLIISGTYLITINQPPIYQAKTKILIKNIEVIPSNLQPLLGFERKTTKEDQVEEALTTISSEMILEKVVNALENNKLKEEEIKNKVSYIRSRIKKIEKDQTGNTITIVVESTDKEETAKIANAIAQTYISWKIEDDNRVRNDVYEKLKEKFDEESKKLAEADEKLKQFTMKGFRLGLTGVLAAQLVDCESNLEKLKKKYTSNNPQVIELEQKMEIIRKQLKEASDQELEYKRLEREHNLVASSWQNLKIEKDKLESIINSRIESVQLLDKAYPPQKPIRPKKGTNIAIGGLFGLIIGFIIAFISETIDTSILTVEDVESFTGMPVIGVIPFTIKTEEKVSKIRKIFTKTQFREEPFKKLILYQGPRSHMAESFRALRANLSFTISEKKVLLFSSSGPKEGKTLTLCNYGIAAAETGIKTLIIDADLRKSAIHKLFGLPREPGFTDVILKQIDWQKTLRGTTDFLLSHILLDKVLQMPGIENLKIITAGSFIQNPLEIIGSNELDEFIKAIRHEFDLILFDCSPFLIFADGLILSRKVDGVVIVYQIGRTPRQSLKRVKTQLENIKANIVGIVVNGLRMEEVPYYYKSYYYSKYYQEEKKI